MRTITVAALTALLAMPAFAQGQDPKSAGVGNSNTTDSATADAPLGNPNDEHSNTVATESSTDLARSRTNNGSNDTGPNHSKDGSRNGNANERTNVSPAR
jgi:hypothetical protein